MNAGGNTKGRIIVVQGAQWGSEAKGMVASAIGLREKVNFAVRTGMVNAGHTVYYGSGGKFPHKMQQLPVGWTNPNSMLVLGAGAFIHPEILAREIQAVTEATGRDIRNRLLIDYRCGLHLPEHTELAGKADRHHKMGATGKGCSEAVVAKISGRGTERGKLFATWLQDTAGPGDKWLSGLTLCDTAHLLNREYDKGATLLLEGTQGTLLDLHLGPYPYVTHKQTQAMQWAMECGLAGLGLNWDVVLVARTYPIRVAGNSGPMPHEIEWTYLTRQINQKLERSGKVPMVAEWAIRDFEKIAEELASSIDWCGYMPHLPGLTLRPNWRVGSWGPDQRLQFQYAASEFYKSVLERLGGPAKAELAKLWEMTTVTNKLRRISAWDPEAMKEAVMLNRPNRVVLTFANYEHPQIWGETSRAYKEGLAPKYGNYPYTAITTGPRDEHYLTLE